MYVAMYTRPVAKMIRKQVYIGPDQDRFLKRRSRELGVTEAELIRRGIEAVAREPRLPLSREKALAEMRRFWRKRAAMRVPQTGRTWTREELYEERLEPFSR